MDTHLRKTTGNLVSRLFLLCLHLLVSPAIKGGSVERPWEQGWTTRNSGGCSNCRDLTVNMKINCYAYLEGTCRWAQTKIIIYVGGSNVFQGGYLGNIPAESFLGLSSYWSIFNIYIICQIILVL